MNKGELITDDTRIREILSVSKTIAVVGVSPKQDRDSYQVASYLKENGYTLIPIRPAQKEILGEPALPSLDDVPEPVDIINVFRKPEQIPAHAGEALRLHPKVFWMQLGIENETAAQVLMEAGIDVVMNRCIKVEHERLFKNKPA